MQTFFGAHTSCHTTTSWIIPLPSHTLCPHSCALGKNFPVGHPSQNCSRLRRISRSVTHPKIALGQARLISEFFRDRLPEKKLQDMSILLILLSLELGYHILLPPPACRSFPHRPRAAPSPTARNSSPCRLRAAPPALPPCTVDLAEKRER
uniref:Uncharacterized protein n=1 Tax=Oryza rufipogon TaxID=4529 RepID=A0A0E0R073_ORYRU